MSAKQDARKEQSKDFDYYRKSAARQASYDRVAAYEKAQAEKEAAKKGE